MRTDSVIYLDHAATTPTDPRVLEAMLPYFSQVYGNPSSIHRMGRQAEKAVQSARQTVAGLLNCRPSEIVFTSCGSESDNLALRGTIQAMLRRSPGTRPRLLTSRAEHHAISHTAQQIAETMACDVEFLPVEQHGVVRAETLAQALTNQSTLVSLMVGNNEVGTVQPIQQLAAIAHERGAVFHTDAVQAGGQVRLDVQALGVDLLSLSAHKFYGPKGVGLLYVRDGIDLVPTQSGGGQEQDRRAGTHNVPLIVGLAKALELAYAQFDARTAHLIRLRDRLISGVLVRVTGARLTGHPTERLPNHASFVIEGIEANALLMHLDLQGIAASSGSACTVGNPEPSEVLLAMGLSPEWALGSLRLTIGTATTEAEIDQVLMVLPTVVEKLRGVRLAQTV